MKRIAALAPALVLVLAACGGESDDSGSMSDAEQQAADSLAQQFESGDTEAAQESAQCTGDEIVSRVGLETLKEDGFVDENNEAVQDQGEQDLSAQTSDQIASAFVECNDWDAQGETLKQQDTLQASDEQVDEFVECAKEVDEADYHAILQVSISSEHGDQEAAERGAEAFQQCQSEAGLMPAPGGQQQDGQQGDGQGGQQGDQEAPADE